MKSTAVELFKRVKAMWEVTHSDIIDLRAAIIAEPDLVELVDYAFALKRALELVKDTRKELEALGELAQKFACVRCVALSHDDAIRTGYCTATADMKPIAQLPKKAKDPAGYRALMLYLGVPENLLSDNDEAEVMRPHFPGLMEHLAKLMEEGKPMPPGIDVNKTWPKYALRFTHSKKEVDA